jgi:hypothetical protein
VHFSSLFRTGVFLIDFDYQHLTDLDKTFQTRSEQLSTFKTAKKALFCVLKCAILNGRTYDFDLIMYLAALPLRMFSPAS